MTLCEQMSDRMPAVARRESAWTAEEQAHLDACAECRGEWAVVAAASGLGAGIADALDPHHVTERVLGRLRAARSRSRERRWGLVLAGLAAAAAVVLAVWTGPPRGDLEPASAGAHSLAARPVALPLPELDTLGTQELEAVLETLDVPLGTTVPAADTNDLDGLNSQELQTVLDALEG